MKRYIGHDEWNIGLVPQSAADIAANGLVQPVRWLNPGPRWTFVADPFVTSEPDGAFRLYVERMDYIATKGAIWTGLLRPDDPNTWVDLEPLFSAEWHLSFPFPFRHNGVEHLLCESWEAGGASIYARDADWRFEKMIAPGGRAVLDPALHHDGERWWLFCCHAGPESMRQLYLYHADDPYGSWVAHPDNPVVDNLATARPAGPLFMTPMGLIRPAQDGTTGYGGALTLNRVIELTPRRFRQELVRRLDPVEPYGQGLHTLCPAGEWTVIDGKRWCIDPLDLPRKLLSRRRILKRRANLRRNGPMAG